MGKIRNVQFEILQTLGIIFVVVGHSGGNSTMNIMGDWFSYYSFHMPLFIFISGYFYNIKYEDSIMEFCLKKIKKLVIPYFIFNFIYGFIAVTLKKAGIVEYNVTFDFKSLFISPWQTGHQFYLNVASWFVLALFLIQIFFVFLRKILGFIRLNNEYIISSITLILGLIGVKLSYLGYNNGWYITLIHILFGVPFYQLGYLYKSKLEKKDKINNYIYFFILFVIQFILHIWTNGKISSSMVTVTFNNSESNILMPFLTGITGIMFWMRVSKVLEPSFRNSRGLSFISKNTWTIMMHHQFIFFIINFAFLTIKNTCGIFISFNTEVFKRSMWYKYEALGSNKFIIFYVVAGLVIPLFIKYSLYKFKSKNKIIEYIYNVF